METLQPGCFVQSVTVSVSHGSAVPWQPSVQLQPSWSMQVYEPLKESQLQENPLHELLEESQTQPCWLSHEYDENSE